MPKRLPEVSVPSTITDDKQQPADSVTHDSLRGNSPLDSSKSTAALDHGTTTDTALSLDYHLDDFSWDMSLDPQLDGSISAQMAEEEMGRITSTPQIADPAIQNEAFVKISKINVELHSYLSSVEIDRPHLDFCSSAHPPSILSVDGHTMPELVPVAFQDFIGVLSGLNKTAVPITNDINQPLVLIITSCYVQIITIFEEVSVQIRKRLEAIAWNPIQPTEGIKFGAFPIEDAHLQDVIISQIVESLREKADRCRGVQQSMVSPPGTVMSFEILSSQSDLLHGQLESKDQASVPRSIGLKSANQHLRSTLTAAT
ncbi:uncharacterized protein BDZ83DRAFT_782780 [Colletotrichum acutatum]|uniref:Uncharacterized protein n=1 Tax=Glomerella acutata TaxID=27357 RepID=A0AAD8UGR6_GLOAC|nr:uncharacterized protein BDZ83DRAFT_782780 [Colletotrichum acutatum]KAK1722853.1 hypothetical protein BDZ83DRAFT_782780 [Colletotrichum acutatum]